MKRHLTFPGPLLFAVFAFSCGPKIYSFDGVPRYIGPGDASLLSWKLRGRPALSCATASAGDPENPAKQYLSYRLIAHRFGKTAYWPLTITRLGDTAIDYIYINTIRKNDSAVAAGTRDTLQWGRQFLLHTVSSMSHRTVVVTHLARTATLSGDGTPSSAFEGLPNSGDWRISAALTPGEVLDTSQIPGRLMLKTTIIHSSH